MKPSATLDPSDSGSTRFDDEALDSYEARAASVLSTQDQETISLVGTTDLALFDEVIALCRERLSRADRILLLIQEGKVLEIKGSYGSKAAFVIMKEEISQAIIRRVRGKQRAIFISDALSDEELGARQSIKKIGQRSVLCAPITIKGETVGILYADSISLIGAFTEAELRWSIRLTTALSRSLLTAKREQPKKKAAAPGGLPELPRAAKIYPWQKAVAEEPSDRPNRDPMLGLPRPSSAEKVVFLRSLACMLSSGFPIYGALEILGQSGSRFSPYAMKMADDIGRGWPLSKAFARYPYIFSLDYIQLLIVGENSGTLDISMVSLADREERQMQLRGKVIGALTYPAIILIFCMLGCMLAPPLFLNDFFLNLAASNVELPLITKLVMGLSTVLGNPLSWILAGSLLFLARPAWGMLRQRQDLFAKVEEQLFRLPIFGELYRTLTVLKFIRALELQLNAGIYLDKSINLAASASGSPQLQAQATLAVERILAGESFAFALSRSEFFPEAFVEFINVGEETGRLSDMLGFVEALLSAQAEETIETTQALVEPLAMAMVGLMVGVVALACLLPLVQMIQSFV